MGESRNQMVNCRGKIMQICQIVQIKEIIIVIRLRCLLMCLRTCTKSQKSDEETMNIAKSKPTITQEKS